MDPKDKSRQILRDAFNTLPRTRRGRGWFIPSGRREEFLNYLLNQLFNENGITLIDLGIHERIICDVLLKIRGFSSEQQRAEAVLEVISTYAIAAPRGVLERAIRTLPAAGFMGSAGWYAHESERERFINQVIDELFTKQKNIAMDTVYGFTFVIFEVLIKTSFLSEQERAVKVLGALRKKYKDSL